MSKTTEDNIAERQGEIGEIRDAGFVSSALDDLGNAEDCETPSDFDANIDNLIDNLEQALVAARAVRS